MVDVVDPATRSRMMAGIRGRDTRIELKIRKALHARGLRYRVNDRSLPGRPDIVLPRWRSVVFVHGCFWHAHDCGLCRMPATRPEFWKAKLEGNQARDKKNRLALLDAGWRVATIWECSIRGKGQGAIDRTCDLVVDWLGGSAPTLNLSIKDTKVEAVPG